MAEGEVPEPEQVAAPEGTAAPKEDAEETAPAVPVKVGGEYTSGETETEGETKTEGETETDEKTTDETDKKGADERELEFVFSGADVKASEAKGKGTKKEKKKDKKPKGDEGEKKKKKPKEQKPKRKKKEKQEERSSEEKLEDRPEKGPINRSISKSLSKKSVSMVSKSSHRYSYCSQESVSSGSESYSSEEEDSKGTIKVGFTPVPRAKGKGKKDVLRVSVSIAESSIDEDKKTKGKGKMKKKRKQIEEGYEIILDEKEIATQQLDVEAKAGVPQPAQVTEAVPPPPKERKEKKRKPQPKREALSAKELKRLEEERKRQEEAQAAKEAEELRLRLIELKKAAIEKDKRNIVEQSLRVEQLEETSEYVKEIKQATADAYMADKLREEWINYLVCDGRPDPADVPQMNTYLHLWELEIENMTTDQAIYRTNEMCKLMDKLQQLMDDPFDVSETKQADWKWIRSMFREHQKENLDFCTYRLIRNLDIKLNRIDIPSADFRLKEKNFALCLWVPMQLPIPTPNPRNPSRPRVHVDWPEMSMNVLFPTSLDCESLVLRAMYVKYDHLSDSSASYDHAPTPELFLRELSEHLADEWRNILVYKYNNRLKAPVEAVTNEEGETVVVRVPDRVLQPGELPPFVPYQRLEPSASTHTLAIEDEAIANAKQALEVTVNNNVVNLRKYVILGGVYYLDLFVQPPQPQEMVSFEIFNTKLILPCRIEKAPFYVQYSPPKPSAGGAYKQPEEIEIELMQQKHEFDKLIFVTLQLPQHILWMDVPQVCHWDEDTKEWTTYDIHDFKHIEETGDVTFRTGKFSPFAIATYKYPNLPFQAWELRPEADGSVILQITAAILFIEFHVKDHTVCLTQLLNAPHNVMDQHLNVYYKLPHLIRIMREAGVDIFPDFDTFFYVEGTCEKFWPLERQTYYGMAMTAIAYNFCWSRWNMTSDFRTIVMQARVYRFDKHKQTNFSTCMVTTLKSVMIECTEVSPAFSDEPCEGTKFSADLYHLIKQTANMATKDRISESSLTMVDSLAKLLIATRFLSFS